MKSLVQAALAVAVVWLVCYLGHEYPWVLTTLALMIIAYFTGVAHTSWSIFREREEDESSDLPTTM